MRRPEHQEENRKMPKTCILGGVRVGLLRRKRLGYVSYCSQDISVTHKRLHLIDRLSNYSVQLAEACIEGEFDSSHSFSVIRRFQGEGRSGSMVGTGQ